MSNVKTKNRRLSVSKKGAVKSGENTEVAMQKMMEAPPMRKMSPHGEEMACFGGGCSEGIATQRSEIKASFNLIIRLKMSFKFMRNQIHTQRIFHRAVEWDKTTRSPLSSTGESVLVQVPCSCGVSETRLTCLSGCRSKPESLGKHG